LQRAAVDVKAHGLQQIALRHRRDRSSHFSGRPKEIVDQRVDRAFHLAPRAARNPEPHALLGLSFLADALTDSFQLLRHALIGGDDFVERIGNLALDAESVARHSDREVADANCLECREKLLKWVTRAVGRVIRCGSHTVAELSGWLGVRLHQGLLTPVRLRSLSARPERNCIDFRSFE